MKLLILSRYGRTGASSRLRTLQYVPALAACGIDASVESLFDDDYIAQLYSGRRSMRTVVGAYVRRLRSVAQSRNHDVLWIEKELWPWVPSLPELALVPAGPRIVVDFDDAVFHRYDLHRNALVRKVLGRKLDVLMVRADLVTAGNQYLADRAAAAGAKSIALLPTVVDLARYAPKRRSAGEQVTVGWIGSPATAPYLQPLFPALGELGGSIAMRALAIGANPEQVAGTLFEPVAWHEETEVGDLSRCDIGIMPLRDTPWEQGKCGYKLIQYMALGLPVVASAVGANNQIVSHGVDGFLVTSPQEWSDALALLAQDPDMRQRMGEAGRRKVEQSYSLQGQAPRLVAMLQALMPAGTSG